MLTTNFTTVSKAPKFTLSPASHADIFPSWPVVEGVAAIRAGPLFLSWFQGPAAFDATLGINVGRPKVNAPLCGWVQKGFGFVRQCPGDYRRRLTFETRMFRPHDADCADCVLVNYMLPSLL